MMWWALPGYMLIGWSNQQPLQLHSNIINLIPLSHPNLIPPPLCDEIEAYEELLSRPGVWVKISLACSRFESNSKVSITNAHSPQWWTWSPCGPYPEDQSGRTHTLPNCSGDACMHEGLCPQSSQQLSMKVVEMLPLLNPSPIPHHCL